MNLKFGAAMAATAMMASVVAPAAAETPEKIHVAYSDVSADHTHYSNIMEARMLGMLWGYLGGEFKPGQALTRANVVKALGKYVVESSGKEVEDFDLIGVEPFNDVQSDYPDQELYTYSLIVKQAGIFKGSNNNLMPRNLIQRQQMAQVLVNAFSLEDLSEKESRVVDNDKAWIDFRASIDILLENGVTTEESFRPTESTTRGQFAAFLVRSYKVSEGMDPEKPYPSPIVSVDTPDDITFIVGDTPKLPETVEVTLESGINTIAAVEWDMGNLDTEEIGTYVLTGKVTGTGLTASLRANVKEPTYTEVASFWVFDGVIVYEARNLSESALDPANYKYNGGPLPEGTTIEGDESGVVITLPKPQGVITETIRYTFEITQNVRTKDGQIIIGNASDRDLDEFEPVNASVTGVFLDNVAPTLVSAHYVIPSAGLKTTDKIQLTFSEAIAPIFRDLDTIDPDDIWQMEKAYNQNFENLYSIMDDYIIEVEGKAVEKDPLFTEIDDFIFEDNKISIPIPSISINQDSTITIMPEGEENEELIISDGVNSVEAPITKTITKGNVIVIDPEVLSETN